MNFVSYDNMAVIMNAIGLKFDALTGAYVPKGNVTFANLPATLSASNLGFVYNVTDAFTTDSRFIGGAGVKYPAGTNVVVIDASTTSTPDYKFDVFSGFIDLDDIYAKITEAVELVAPKFSETAAYSEGDYVVYGGAIYKFNTDKTAGAWDSTKVNSIGDVTDLVDAFVADLQAKINAVEAKADNTAADLAPAFSASAAYSIGDYVSYGGKIYKFTSAHAAGAWTGSDVTEITGIVAEVKSTSATVKDQIENRISNKFDDATAYVEGDIVYYQGRYYQFTADHAAGAWTGSDATEVVLTDLLEVAAGDVGDLEEAIGNISGSIADAFDPTETYVAGDVVVYDNTVYMFNTAHTGAWTGTDADEVTLEELINDAEPDEIPDTGSESMETLLDLLDNPTP